MKTFSFIIVLLLVPGISLNSFILSNNDKSTDISERQSEPNHTPQKWINGGHIFQDEITDTVIRLARDTTPSFPWIFQKLYPIQHIGREKHPLGDSYHAKFREFDLSKVHGRYINCDSVNNYIQDNCKSATDTIFLRETIQKDNYYKIYFWQSLDSVYTVTLGRDRLWHVRAFNAKNDDSFIYIDSWRKKELKELGKNEMPPTGWTSNPYSNCATRIIISPDSVILDMFKFYRPYGLENRYKNHKK